VTDQIATRKGAAQQEIEDQLDKREQEIIEAAIATKKDKDVCGSHGASIDLGLASIDRNKRTYAAVLDMAVDLKAIRKQTNGVKATGDFAIPVKLRSGASFVIPGKWAAIIIFALLAAVGYAIIHGKLNQFVDAAGDVKKLQTALLQPVAGEPPTPN
jgi:hypothetical protein